MEHKPCQLTALAGAWGPARLAASHSSAPAMAVCVCHLQKDEFLRLAINAIHNDLISRNEAFQSLALTFVSNSESPTHS